MKNKTSRIHYWHVGNLSMTACDNYNSDLSDKISTNPKKVTCRDCKKSKIYLKDTVNANFSTIR